MEWDSAGRGFNGTKLRWSQLEQILSGSAPSADDAASVHSPAREAPEMDTDPQPRPRLSLVRGTDMPAAPPETTTIPFAELHAYSNYHFLNGASEAEDMVRQAQRLGLSGLALIERDGFYGAMRFAEAAAEEKLSTIFGAELSTDNGVLTVLCRGPEGYRRLSRVITAAHMQQGNHNRQPRYPDFTELARAADNHWYVLLNAALASHAEDIVTAFGANNVIAECNVGFIPEDADNIRLVTDMAATWGLITIVSCTPNSATRADARLAAAKHALSDRRDLNNAEADCPPLGGTWLRNGAHIRAALPPLPHSDDMIANTVHIASECAFTLNLIAPELPTTDVPAGHNEMSWLEHTVWERAEARYATRTPELWEQARAQITYELDVIKQLNFPGYFLIVCGIVDFCKGNNILCQGRGSAANSAVCFALGITNVEPISAGLLFERFLSPERDGPPDIDIDIESGRREEAIQYVYNRYGRDYAAQVANVNTYRRRGAIRDAARALGYPQGSIDAWARRAADPPEQVIRLAEQFRGHPRHLSIHSGGMVICDRPIADVVPVQWSAMENRSVVQWDKDDCASAGLVKFDLLGLGMLEALHHMVDLVQEHHGKTINLWELDLTDSNIYAMLSRADAVGVFQVESRAQLATLPRLKPRTFFDLVVEVALIRPGPIQGGSVHPYIKRRNGIDPVTFDHPCLKPALEKTLGIPLFQEQLMQIAKDAAGFSAAEADNLRRAMGSKRSPARMAALKKRFYDGLFHTNGIEGQVADVLWNKMTAFAAYGFPESHSQSFAALVFFSAWFKFYYPAEFCVGLLRAQPMGFYSPQSLISDARRHGVTILPVCVNQSKKESDCPSGQIRLGLNLVKGVGDAAAERIEAEAPFSGIADLARRASLSVRQVEALARAGALECFGVDRRQAQWAAGIAATESADMLPGLSSVDVPSLPGMSAFELLAADVAHTGVTSTQQPMALLRSLLDARGITPAARLLEVADGTRIVVAGVVTHRQRPQTASDVTFMGLEDETGLMNVLVSPGLWARYQRVAGTAKALVIRGIIRNSTGAPTLIADKLEPLAVAEALAGGSRDFR